MDTMNSTPFEVTELLENSAANAIGQIDNVITQLVIFKKSVEELKEESLRARLAICATDDDTGELVSLNLEKELQKVLDAKNDIIKLLDNIIK